MKQMAAQRLPKIKISGRPPVTDFIFSSKPML
jgi:hypothetical protein